jgi:hypothetical protein
MESELDYTPGRCRAVVAGVLYQAAVDYQNLPETDSEWPAASKWLFNRESCGPFSFLWCCDILGLSPSHVRGKLARNALPNLAKIHIHGTTGPRLKTRKRRVQNVYHKAGK